MIKRASALLILVLVTTTLFTASCELGNDCIFDDRFYTVDFATLENKMIYTPGSDVPQFQPVGGRTILYSEYAISFLPIVETYRSEPEPTSSLFRPINSANACFIPALISEEKITNISITANRAFNNDYPAGSELRDLFNVYTIYLAEGFNTQPLPTYLVSDPTVADQTTFLLTVPPANPNEDIRFTITYELDGTLLKEFTYTTEPRRLIRSLDF